MSIHNSNRVLVVYETTPITGLNYLMFTCRQDAEEWINKTQVSAIRAIEGKVLGITVKEKTIKQYKLESGRSAAPESGHSTQLVNM